MHWLTNPSESSKGQHPAHNTVHGFPFSVCAWVNCKGTHCKKHVEISCTAPISCENISLELNCAKVCTTLAGAGRHAGPTQIVYQFPWRSSKMVSLPQKNHTQFSIHFLSSLFPERNLQGFGDTKLTISTTTTTPHPLSVISFPLYTHWARSFLHRTKNCCLSYCLKMGQRKIWITEEKNKKRPW